MFMLRKRFVCVGYGIRVLEPKGEWGGRVVKEKLHDSANDVAMDSGRGTKVVDDSMEMSLGGSTVVLTNVTASGTWVTTALTCSTDVPSNITVIPNLGLETTVGIYSTGQDTSGLTVAQKGGRGVEGKRTRRRRLMSLILMR
ncbi:hypothetical protein Tco_0454661 [Tanacetum coccineum]